VQFDLPKDLVARQERSTLRRLVEEMREAGLSDRDIRAREAELRANAHDQTLRSIKEFFLLSKIAEAEELKVEDEDVDQEIELMAARSDETPRRVRARIDKEGLADGLVSQILERKAIARVMESAEFKVVPLIEDRPVETLEETTAAIETEPPEESESSETESVTESATAEEPGP
jgi:trigger factor